jgi:polyhydroxyalkanoate synthesis regulator phasin
MPESDQPADKPKQSIYFVPQQLMMQAFQSWQQIVNQYTQDLLSNRQVLDTSGKTLENVMQLKSQADRAMEMAISSMQMPTKSDIELLLQKLSMLENLVRDLNDKVDQLIDREQQL